MINSGKLKLDFCVIENATPPTRPLLIFRCLSSLWGSSLAATSGECRNLSVVCLEASLKSMKR